ncbi:Ig-like domain-containing protein [Maribacter sp. 2308TA10-17]|uniref:Ig-like domain-containing protein n=1 Tax=Maribacter sp. 2308TA10-17 TaxID=3386276 RepID=UPI0039BD71AD
MKHSSIFNSLIIILAFTTLFSCSDDPMEEATVLSNITLNKTEISIGVGQTESIAVTSDTQGLSVSWQSSNVEVAQVKDGVIQAIKPGNCTITAKAGDVMAICNTEVFLTLLEINISTLELQLGASESLSLTSEIGTLEVTWSSDNTDVATVIDGDVQAVGVGSCIVTAQVGEASVSTEVIVYPNQIEFDKTEINLVIGETETLSIIPEVGELAVNWSSDNTDIVTVENGIVQALSAGIATVTARVGEASVSIEVIVYPNQIELDKTEINLAIGEMENLSVISEVGELEVNWSSDNPEVAQVNEQGLITALTVGEAQIIAQVGDATASSLITVTDSDSDPDIYVVGEEGSVAKIWKNGVSNELTGGSIAQAWAIDIDGTDIYIAGNQFNGSKLVARIWKNGTPTNLSDGTKSAYATDIQVVNGDTYVSGFEFSSNSISVAKVWINGVSTTLSNPSNTAQARSIKVVNGNVYVVGFEYEGSKSIAKVWTNGVATNLTDGSFNAEAFGLDVSNGDVYVVGNDGFVATVWKNNIPTALTDGTSTADAYDIDVVNGDVYVAGENGSNQATIWKNGVPTELTGQFVSSGANAIHVEDGTVYVAGFISNGGTQAKVWKDGVEMNLTNGANTSVARDIILK